MRAELGRKHSDPRFWGVRSALPASISKALSASGAEELSCKETADEEVTWCLQPVVR